MGVGSGLFMYDGMPISEKVQDRMYVSINH